MPGRSGRAPRLGVHTRLEVLEALDRQVAIAGGQLAGVRLENVQQDDEQARSPIEDSVARLGEPDAELAQLAVDLGADRMLRRRRRRVMPLRYSST